MAHELLMPQLGLTMEEGTVSQWLKHEGDAVKAGEAVLEISTDKLTNEVTSEFDGVLIKIVAQEGEDIPVKGLLAYIGEAGEAVGESSASDESSPAVSAQPVSTGRIRISPLAKKTAAKLGVDYSGIVGSGANGRIVQKDVLTAAEAARPAAPAAPASVQPPRTSGSALALEDGDSVSKLTGMRKVVAQRMLQSHTEIPNVTMSIKADVTELMAFRKMLLEKTGTKYSVNDLILKAAAKCVARHPEINVAYDDGQVIQRAHVNIGMAVALDAGLIVPVIRDADKKGLDALSAEAKDLAARARDNKLTPDEYKGSTFSVSNLGMYGIETFTPIINQPDACILGVAAAQQELDIDSDGKLFKKQVMRLCLTMDHRLLDGAVAAKFLADLRDILEAPLSIIL